MNMFLLCACKGPEHDRDVPERDGPRHRRDVRVLAQRDEQRRREEVDREHDDGAGEEDDPGPLQVDAQHVVLLRAVRLPAQRLQRARHAQLQWFVVIMVMSC